MFWLAPFAGGICLSIRRNDGSRALECGRPSCEADRPSPSLLAGVLSGDTLRACQNQGGTAEPRSRKEGTMEGYFEARVADSRQAAYVKFIGAECTVGAEEIERLIDDLVVLRSKLTPPVPEDPKHACDKRRSITVSHVAVRSDDGARAVEIGWRNPGYGWLFYFAKAKDARSVAAQLTAAADRLEGAGRPRH